MISSSQLSDDQKAVIRQWAEEGATMADIQRRLGDDLGMRATYMETRFLILDLGIVLKEDSKKEEAKPADPADGEAVPEENDLPAETGEVSVTVDALAVPGAVVSGKVQFADGQRAMWYLDQAGRLGLDPDVAGYRPSREDVAEFQRQLTAALRKGGY